MDGTLVTTTFTDANGSTTTTLSWKDGKIRYLNPGGSGEHRHQRPGNDQQYTAPGLGFIVGNTGLSIVTIDNATGEVLSIDGSADGRDQ